MSILLEFLRASTLADLPPVARQYFDDDEHFIEAFGGLDDVSKTEMIAGGLTACLKYNIKTDHEVARMMALSVLSQEDDYDEKKDEDNTPAEQVAEVVVPMFEPPRSPASVEKKPRAKPDPNAPKKPRGRPPKYPNTTAFKCDMCEFGCASSGSLYNHYHSKPHIATVLKYIQQATDTVVKNPNTHYKIVVETRNKKVSKDLGLTQEYPDEGTFLDLVDVANDPENPIAYIGLSQATERTYPSGRPYISWSKASVSN